MTDDNFVDPVGRGGLDPLSHDPEAVPVDVLIDVETLARGIASQNELLQSILETLQYINVPQQILEFEIPPEGVISNIYHNHTKLYVEWIVITANPVLIAVGTTFTLHVGEKTYNWHYDISMPNAIPFPILIDRGIDVWFTAPAAVGEFHGFIIVRVHNDPIGAR